jgi:hypothetical protein
MKQTVNKASLVEYIFIALMAALGIAVKPLLGPFVQLFTGSIGVPKGVLAGGIYMMFLVLPYGLTKRRLAATMTATVQAFLAIFTGIGSLGLITFITYLPAGIAVDSIMLLFLLCRQPRASAPACFFSGVAANLTGSLLVGLMIFAIPLVPLLLSLSVAALSGGLGGLLAYYLLNKIKKLGIVK